jgi:hypothetical protein
MHRRFPIRLSKFYRLLASRLPNFDPDESYIEVDGENIIVRMGESFFVSFPVSTLRQAGLDRSPAWAWGVHGSKGTWLVNGSRKGIVSLWVDPPAQAEIAAGDLRSSVELKKLRLSLKDPKEFLRAIQTQP